MRRTAIPPADRLRMGRGACLPGRFAYFRELPSQAARAVFFGVKFVVWFKGSKRSRHKRPQGIDPGGRRSFPSGGELRQRDMIIRPVKGGGGKNLSFSKCCSATMRNCIVTERIWTGGLVGGWKPRKIRRNQVSPVAESPCGCFCVPSIVAYRIWLGGGTACG